MTTLEGVPETTLPTAPTKDTHLTPTDTQRAQPIKTNTPTPTSHLPPSSTLQRTPPPPIFNRLITTPVQSTTQWNQTASPYQFDLVILYVSTHELSNSDNNLRNHIFLEIRYSNQQLYRVLMNKHETDTKELKDQIACLVSMVNSLATRTNLNKNNTPSTPNTTQIN